MYLFLNDNNFFLFNYCNACIIFYVTKFDFLSYIENSQRQLFPPLVDETEAIFDSKNELNILSHKSYDGITERPGSATYIPTPVESNSKPPGILKSSSSAETPATSYVPEYKPTPISRLKECATSVPVKASKSVYTPEFPILVRKKKNVEEYDPTEVTGKCIPRKTVTFVDETDTSMVPVIQISSDDDIDDDESAPKFSDDDFDEESTPTVNSTKHVPDVITIKEEPAVEEKIDEFSVVDKILVDCKKNEMFLNSFKKIPSKTNDLSSKIRKNNKDTVVQPEKQEIKKIKNNSTSSTKIEKNITVDKVGSTSNTIRSTKTEKSVLDNKVDCSSINKNNTISSNKAEKNISGDKLDSNSKLKYLKDEVLDLINSPTKAKNTDLKKGDKNVKKEKTIEKEKKISGSHSTHSKEKSKKDSKETDKHTNVKKHSHAQKTDSVDKSKKSSKHPSSDSSDKKESKKRIENHTIKDNDRSHSPSKKKRFHENENSSKTVQPHIVKLKEKKSSNNHSAKRKTSSDSDFERDSSKSKSSHKDKKVKSDVSAFPSKKMKLSECQVSDESKSLNNEDDKIDNGSQSDSDLDETALNDLISSSESDLDEECRRIFEECYPEESNPPKHNRKEVSKQNLKLILCVCIYILFFC